MRWKGTESFTICRFMFSKCDQVADSLSNTEAILPPPPITKIEVHLCLRFVLHFPFLYNRGSSFSVMITNSVRLHCWLHSSSYHISPFLSYISLHPPFRHPFPFLSSCWPSFVSPLPPPNVYHLIPLFLDLSQAGHSHDSFPPLSPSFPGAALPFPLPDTLRDWKQWLRWRRSASGVLCWVVAVRRRGRKALWNIWWEKWKGRTRRDLMTRTNLETETKKVLKLDEIKTTKKSMHPIATLKKKKGGTITKRVFSSTIYSAKCIN